MTFAAPDVASLSNALYWWERGEYVACGLVAIACAGEYVAEFTNWLTGGIKEKKDHLAKDSTRLLVFALLLELVCLVQTNAISGKLVESLDKEARDATAELDRLKSPRSLVNTSEAIIALERFKDTEYTFSAVFQDEESINLLKAIDGVLQSAGWKRTKPPGGFPAINVFGKDIDFAVPLALNTGVQVSVDSSEPLAVLQSRILDQEPPLIRAAIALNLNLANNISPAQEEAKEAKTNVEPGSSTTIRIAVGKKP